MASEDISVNITQASRGVQEVNENISQASLVDQEVTHNISTVRDTTDLMATRCLEIREFTCTLHSLAQDMEQTMDYVGLGEAKFDIGMVKTAHLTWKINLEAVLGGRKKIAAESIPDHHSCAFGKWYDNVRGTVANDPLFKEIALHHKNVHSTVKEGVNLYNKGDAVAARTKMVDF